MEFRLVRPLGLTVRNHRRSKDEEWNIHLERFGCLDTRHALVPPVAQTSPGGFPGGVIDVDGLDEPGRWIQISDVSVWLQLRSCPCEFSCLCIADVECFKDCFVRNAQQAEV